jgi:hypothetical protein
MPATSPINLTLPTCTHTEARSCSWSDQLWFLGNLPTLQQLSKMYAQLLCRPSPLLEHFAQTRDASLPTTISAWKQAQLDDSAFLTEIPPESLLLSDGLSLFKDPDFPSRILVPPSLREALVRQHHADLQHHSRPQSSHLPGAPLPLAKHEARCSQFPQRLRAL